MLLRGYMYAKNKLLAFNSKFLVCALVYKLHREYATSINHMHLCLINKWIP